MMAWTREQVDAAVSKWNRDLEIATHNILELMDDVHYRGLTVDGMTPLTGKTAEVVTGVQATLEELWQLLPGLTKVLDDVNARYRKLPWFKAAAELAQIQELLDGESVKFTTKTTYAQRGLLTPDEVTRAMSPQRVLEAMIAAYDRAKAVVVEVGEAVRRLTPELERATVELADLQQLARSIGETPPELARAQARVDALKLAIASDPLAVADDFARDIEPVLVESRRRLADAKAEAAALDSLLAGADRDLAALEAAYAKAKAAYADRLAKIEVAAPLPAPFDANVVGELTSWLGRLRATVSSGRRAAARLGYANWKAQVDARCAECETVERSNAQPLARRDELRGLLDGLHAKAMNTGIAHDATVSALYAQAHAALHARPTQLATAETLVTRYLQAVR